MMAIYLHGVQSLACDSRQPEPKIFSLFGNDQEKVIKGRRKLEQEAAAVTWICSRLGKTSSVFILNICLKMQTEQQVSKATHTPIGFFISFLFPFLFVLGSKPISTHRETNTRSKQQHGNTAKEEVKGPGRA